MTAGFAFAVLGARRRRARGPPRDAARRRRDAGLHAGRHLRRRARRDAGGAARARRARSLLANTYHLHERPGEDVVARRRRAPRLHAAGAGPWLTDSGGYQVTSLAERVRRRRGRRRPSRRPSTAARRAAHARERRRDPGGARRRRRDGARRVRRDARARPAGADAAARRAWRDAMERSLRWAERCPRRARRGDQALFGIVQGGADPELRRASARATAELGFDGYAHGGLGLGEDGRARERARSPWRTPSCPAGAPRYLMGLGRPRTCSLRRRARRRPLRLRGADAQRPPRRALHPRGPLSHPQRALPRGSRAAASPAATARPARASAAPTCATSSCAATSSARGSRRSTTCASTSGCSRRPARAIAAGRFAALPRRARSPRQARARE